MSDVTITVLIDATVTLKVGDVWPDGDAPAEVTAQVVADLMRSCGDRERVLRDWMLTDELDVRVQVDAPNPHWSPSPPLPGFAVVARFQTTKASVW